MPSHREFHTRAADYVRDDFKRQNRDLLQAQGLQFSASWRYRAREMESFAANRSEAIQRHADTIKAIDGRESTATQELDKRHNSVAGRLSALGKTGKARQEQERQGLAQKFEKERMKQHRDLEALKGDAQTARLRYGGRDTRPCARAICPPAAHSAAGRTSTGTASFRAASPPRASRHPDLTAGAAEAARIPNPHFRPMTPPYSATCVSACRRKRRGAAKAVHAAGLNDCLQAFLATKSCKPSKPNCGPSAPHSAGRSRRTATH